MALYPSPANESKLPWRSYHRIAMIIWIVKIIRIAGIIFTKRICLSHEILQRVGINQFTKKPLLCSGFSFLSTGTDLADDGFVIAAEDLPVAGQMPVRFRLAGIHQQGLSPEHHDFHADERICKLQFPHGWMLIKILSVVINGREWFKVIVPGFVTLL